MRRMTLSILLIFSLLVASAFCQYNVSRSMGWSDITSTCTSISCWYALPGSGFSYVSVGADGEMWAVKTDSTIWRWNGSGWVSIPGGLSLISVGSKSQIWGVNSYGQIWQWNGSGWVSIPGGLSYISAAADGTVIGVGSNHQVWQRNGSGWSLLSGLLDEVSVGSQNAIYGRSGTSVFQYVNSSWSLITGTPVASDIAANPDGGLWIRGTNQTAYYSSDLSTWTGMVGQPIVLASGGKYLTVAVGGSGILYHLNNGVLSVSGSTSGNYANWCNNHPNGCPWGAVHTATYQVAFPHGMYGVQGSASGPPSTQLNATSYDVPNPSNCDMLFGDPTSPECQPKETGTAKCSIMGALMSVINWLPPKIELAYTLTAAHGAAISCYTTRLGVKYCFWPVVNWCTGTTTPPDADYTGKNIKDTNIHAYWKTYQTCVRISTSFPWSCFPGVAEADDLQEPFGNCTKN